MAAAQRRQVATLFPFLAEKTNRLLVKSTISKIVVLPIRPLLKSPVFKFRVVMSFFPGKTRVEAWSILHVPLVTTCFTPICKSEVRVLFLEKVYRNWSVGIVFWPALNTQFQVPRIVFCWIEGFSALDAPKEWHADNDALTITPMIGRKHFIWAR